MTITYHHELIQGSDEWLAARCGILTASEMKLIITPTLRIADNDKSRTHMWELLAQRISKYVEPRYISSDMLRGSEDEVEAKIKYNEHYAPVEDIGFITNSKFGFHIGYSPDGMIGEDGLIECKSRCQKYQIQTIVEGAVPEEYVMQIQTGLLVSERKWCDFISYSGGLHMVTIRVYPDPVIQEAIVNAATKFEKSLQEKLAKYDERFASGMRLLPTKRRVEEEIVI